MTSHPCTVPITTTLLITPNLTSASTVCLNLDPRPPLVFAVLLLSAGRYWLLRFNETRKSFYTALLIFSFWYERSVLRKKGAASTRRRWRGGGSGSSSISSLHGEPILFTTIFWACFHYSMGLITLSTRQCEFVSFPYRFGANRVSFLILHNVLHVWRQTMQQLHILPEWTKREHEGINIKQYMAKQK